MGFINASVCSHTCAMESLCFFFFFPSLLYFRDRTEPEALQHSLLSCFIGKAGTSRWRLGNEF